jgi:hypothetical protein
VGPEFKPQYWKKKNPCREIQWLKPRKQGAESKVVGCKMVKLERTFPTALREKEPQERF